MQNNKKSKSKLKILHFSIVFSFFFLFLIPNVSSDSYLDFLTRGLADRLYCQLTGCTMLGNLTIEDNLIVLGNFSLTGSFFNVTVINYNVTGNASFGGDLNVDGNVYDNNNRVCTVVNGLCGIAGVTNSTAWNRSGTDVILSNIGDKVGIGTDNPPAKLSILTTLGVLAEFRGNTQDAHYITIDADITKDAQITFDESTVSRWTIGNDGTDDSFIFRSETGYQGAFTDSGVMKLSKLGVLFVNNSIGIGTDSPQAKLHINGTGVLLNVSNSSDSFLYVDQTTGRVGIGTTTPNEKLTVIGNINVSNNITADTIFANAINISNSSFSFTHNENNSISYSIQNKNSGSNATSLMTTLNDVGGIFGIGIASSSYFLGSMSKPNITALFSRSRGEMDFINTFNQAFVWYVNPSDDNDLNNLVEVMRLERKNLNVSGNITSENVFLPQFIFPHTNETMTLVAANEWANISFEQEEVDLKRGITHTHNDGTNDTFTINQPGIYFVNIDIDVTDTSSGATDIDVAVRLIYINGTEIIGSVFETDIIKQQVETELTHDFLARLNAGDQVKFQFIATDVDVEVSVHGTFGEHPDGATIIIKKIANLK